MYVPHLFTFGRVEWCLSNKVENKWGLQNESKAQNEVLS